MTMGYNDDDNWSNLPADLLILIVKRLDYLDDYIRCTTAVCKSWRNSVSEFEIPCLPPTRYPFLLLAEEVAPGAIISDGEYDSNQDYGSSDTDSDDDDDVEHSGGDEDDDDDGDAEEDNGDEEDYGDEENNNISHYALYLEQYHRYDHNKISVGSSRGMYSLLTGKTYNIDLPEAAGRLILSTNKGWLVTLGRDLQINLLHPLLRHQISLPPMLSLPSLRPYHEDYLPEQASDMFIEKVAISSKIQNNNTAISLYHHHASPSPLVMAIYGEGGFLGFTRLGDKVWTDVNVLSRSFNDIVYHKENFYAVNYLGDVYVFGIEDDEERGFRGIKIASLETDDSDMKYLVEPSLGSGLLLIVRHRKEKYFKTALQRRPKYRTTDFSVWRLGLKSSDSIENISCSLTEENDLGNEAIFIGRNSSVSVSSSDIIKPNSIYFTDDHWEIYLHKGGGHDMGIYDIKRRTIEPHFQEKSVHPISPPLWYI